MTSFTIYPGIERDRRARAVAPVIALPLVTTTLGILYPRRRRQPIRVERVPFRDRRFTLGREGDIAIDDAFLDEHHAELVPTPQGLIIRDLSTTNGTYINDRRADTDILRVGDVVMVGQQRVWFRHLLRQRPSWPERAQPLVDKIRDNPNDDATRLVLADLLTDLGDPRGEFISCQLHGATERADELLALHPLAWAGPFDVPVHDWTFQRGFVDTIYVDDLAEAAPLRASHPQAELRLARPLADLDE